MALPTGVISNKLNTTTLQDICLFYDSENKAAISGNVNTQIIAGLNYGNIDLGSIFTIYQNLNSSGYTGTQGDKCGYVIDSTGVDIGNIFVNIGTITSINAIINNNYFLSPVVTNPYWIAISNAIPYWTFSIPVSTIGNAYIVNGGLSNPFYNYVLPTGITQYFASQRSCINNQTVYFQANTYTLYFYAAPRIDNTTHYSTLQTLTVMIGSQTITNPSIVGNITLHHFIIYSYNFTISTGGNYDLTITTNDPGTDSTWLYTGFNVFISTEKGLLTSIPSGCQGLYACKWVNNNYTGPILKLRMIVNSTDYTQDFYINRTGSSIGTSLGGTGVSLSSWVNSYGGTYGTTILYVVIWYDQSPTSSTGSGKNATQTTASIQPTFNTTGYINFANNVNSYFNLPDGTVPYKTSFVNIVKHGTTTNLQGCWLSCNTYDMRVKSTTYTCEGAYILYQTIPVNLTSGTYTANNVVSFQYDKPNISLSLYVNGTSTGSTNSSNTLVNTTFNCIGSCINGGAYANVASNSFNGQIYHLSMFNTLLSSSDRQLMESISLTFYPNFIAGCSLWFDAKDSSTLIKTGNTTTQWNNKSGSNTNNAVPFVGTSVTYNATGFNNLPCLQFTSSTALYCPLAPQTLSAGTTCFVLFQKTAATFATQGLISRTTAILPGSIAGGFDIWDNVTSYRYVGDGANWERQSSPFSITASTTPTLMSFTIDSTTKIWNEYKNGSSIFTSTAYSYYSDTASNFYIASRYGAAGTYFTGNISEIIVYNTPLINTDRQKVEGYLSWKWGLQANLPADHPYKSVAP